ncbi:MAG: hypothetical protein FJ272_13595, partial [Planctomycetes bacterium]|nr:hypothetical protein [Planctomycetota bacterium]
MNALRCLFTAVGFCFIIQSMCLAASRNELPPPIPLPGEFPYGLAWDGKALWACDFKTPQLCRIDLRTRQAAAVAQLAVKSPSGLSFDGQRFWLVSLGKTV